MVGLMEPEVEGWKRTSGQKFERKAIGKKVGPSFERQKQLEYIQEMREEWAWIENHLGSV